VNDRRLWKDEDVATTVCVAAVHRLNTQRLPRIERQAGRSVHNLYDSATAVYDRLYIGVGRHVRDSQKVVSALTYNGNIRCVYGVT
jgi:hypothetical protein